jgi:hypothetical protein
MNNFIDDYKTQFENIQKKQDSLGLISAATKDYPELVKELLLRIESQQSVIKMYSNHFRRESGDEDWNEEYDIEPDYKIGN